MKAPLPEPSANERLVEPVALEVFLKDVAASGELRAFLGTETGRKFRGLLAGMDPMKGLCEVRTLKPDSVRVLAKVEADSAPSILAFCRGYGAALSVIETLRQAPAEKRAPPQSRKAGRGILPHQV
ncbi:MAG: hypothetical protein V4675_10960 [Verrucomicrobiota bacterium]